MQLGHLLHYLFNRPSIVLKTPARYTQPGVEHCCCRARARVPYDASTNMQILAVRNLCNLHPIILWEFQLSQLFNMILYHHSPLTLVTHFQLPNNKPSDRPGFVWCRKRLHTHTAHGHSRYQAQHMLRVRCLVVNYTPTAVDANAFCMGSKMRPRIALPTTAAVAGSAVLPCPRAGRRYPVGLPWVFHGAPIRCS